MRRLNNLKFLRTWTKTLKRSSKKESQTKCPLPAESDKKEEDNGMGGKIFLNFLKFFLNVFKKNLYLLLYASYFLRYGRWQWCWGWTNYPGGWLIVKQSSPKQFISLSQHHIQELCEKWNSGTIHQPSRSVALAMK